MIHMILAGVAGAALVEFAHTVAGQGVINKLIAYVKNKTSKTPPTN